MTEEIQCTRPKHLLHEFPEDQEYQSSLFVFFLALNVIILAWKQETILKPQFGWDFLRLMHILGCRGRCLPLCILHSLLLQKTTIITMDTLTQINFLHALLIRDDCLLARVSYGESISTGHLMNCAIMVSKEIQNNLLSRTPLSSRAHVKVASLLLLTDWPIIHLLSYIATRTLALGC